MTFIGLGGEKQIGDYVLNEEIAEGPLAQVYQATHIPTGEKVAVKVFNKIKLNSEPDYYIKTQKEISILKKMFHKNIIKLYEIMETAQRLYLVMEFCDGGDLFNYISNRGHLTEKQSCKFFHEIIEALSYLHSQHIAHRDIKPENLLLNTTGKTISLKLIDFGISNIYKDDYLRSSCGTSAFAPPEMYKGEQYNALLSDVWSAGIVLYAMIFGYLPFCDENEQKNINNIINGIYEIPEDTNEDLRDFLSHIIEIDPKKRFNLEQIKNHKWYNTINDNSRPGIIIDKHKIPIDNRIITVCQAYGYDQEKMIESVSDNSYDNYNSAYYIILNKFIRERYDSVSDLFSQDYLDYINDPKNLIDYSNNIIESKKNNNKKNINNDNNKNKNNEEKMKDNNMINDNKKNNKIIDSEINDNNNNNIEIKNNKDNKDNVNKNDKNNDNNSDNVYNNDNEKSINNSDNEKSINNSNNEKIVNNSDNEKIVKNSDNEKIVNNSYNEKSINNSDNEKSINNNDNNGNNSLNFNSDSEKSDNNEKNDSTEKKDKKEYNNNDISNSNNNFNDNIINDMSNNDNINNKDINDNSEDNDDKKYLLLKDNILFLDDKEEEEKKEDKIESSNVSFENGINNINDLNDKDNLRRNEDEDDYFQIKITFKKSGRRDPTEINEIKKSNDLNDSTEDFQLNLFSETERNHNLRNSNNFNDIQKNDILSSSFSELSQNKNLENTTDNNNIIDSNTNTNNQNKNFCEKTNNTSNKEEDIINKTELMKQEKPKEVKMEITKMCLFIKPENKNKKIKSDKKEISNKNQQKKKDLKNKEMKKKKENKLKETDKKYKKTINNLNNKNNVKNYTIIKNRNASATHRKLPTNNYFDSEKKNNYIKNNSTAKRRKIKDVSFPTLQTNLNKNKINLRKKSNLNIKIEGNKISTSRHMKSKINKIYDNKLNNQYFYNNSIDVMNKYSNRLIRNNNSIFNFSSTSKDKNNKKPNNNISSLKLTNDKPINIKMHLVFKTSKTNLSKTKSCEDNKKFVKKIIFRKILFNSNKSFSKNDTKKKINQSSNKKLNDKSFDSNINININKEKNLKKKNKEWPMHTSKDNNIHPPRIYKGPIDLKRIIASKKSEEIMKELINFLNKNEIHFQWNKNNIYKFFCGKNELDFEIEIFSIYNNNSENKNYKLFYFTYLSKAKKVLATKNYLNTLNKILLDKFQIKNYYNQ